MYENHGLFLRFNWYLLSRFWLVPLVHRLSWTNQTSRCEPLYVDGAFRYWGYRS